MRSDPAGLGRGPLTRWLPVFLHAPAEPTEAQPFEAEAGITAGRFLLRVTLAMKLLTVPAMLLASCGRWASRLSRW